MTEILYAVSDMFSYSFITRGVIVGALVALCASMLGVILVLKRYSMIGDGLSHVGFGAMAIGLALGAAPLKAAMPVVIIAAYFLLRLSENSRIKGDSAIALISSSSIAIGIIVNSLAGGTNIDLNSYMFGSILAISRDDVAACIELGIAVLLLILLCFNSIFAITFDETFAKATGVKVRTYKVLLSVMTAITIVIGMRVMGTLLISSLIIFPALSAMRVCRRYKAVMALSVLISMVCFFTGMVAAFMLEIPTGASIVVANLTVFVLMSLAGSIKMKI